jgi:hypothetical protein
MSYFKMVFSVFTGFLEGFTYSSAVSGNYFGIMRGRTRTRVTRDMGVID